MFHVFGRQRFEGFISHPFPMAADNIQAFDCPTPSCHRSLNGNSALNLMRHWNGDHCAMTVPTSFEAPNSLIACRECHTFFEAGKNHCCRTRRLHREALRNSSKNSQLTNANTTADGVEESKNQDAVLSASEVEFGDQSESPNGEVPIDCWGFFDSVDLELFFQKKYRTHMYIPSMYHQQWQDIIRAAEKLACSDDPTLELRGTKAILMIPVLILGRQENTGGGASWE